LARMIHLWSNRAKKPFSNISCPSIPAELLESELFGHLKGAFTGADHDSPGRIAACEGGTLLLDEIGDLPLLLQPKLLRFIQDHEYERIGDSINRRADVRVMAATNIDLEKAVRDGRFREDLFYRLNVIQIALPPLRERQDDIAPLAERLLQFFGSANHRQFLGFSEEALKALRNHVWPGNIRELRNLVEHAAIMCQGDRVGLEHLSDALRPRSAVTQLGDPVDLETIEEQHIRRVLASVKSLQEAADILGIDQATLWRRRKQYGI